MGAKAADSARSVRTWGSSTGRLLTPPRRGHQQRRGRPEVSGGRPEVSGGLGAQAPRDRQAALGETPGVRRPDVLGREAKQSRAERRWAWGCPPPGT